MAQVSLVTDTTHYLPRRLVADLGLKEVSLHVNWGGRRDRERDLPDFDAFYDFLRSRGDSELPTTSQPSVGEFLEVYEPLLEAGHDVVSIHLAAGLSGTCEAARQARERLVEGGLDPARLTVIDSATTCGGLAMVLLAAAAAARAGGDREAVADRAHEARAAMRMWFSIDTLEYLRAGGRVGAARAWLGSALKIKPILTVESEITPVERVRTAARARERLVEFLEASREEGADGWVVQHIQAPEQAAWLVERGRELFGSEPLFVSEAGPVVGAHAGPGMTGVGAIPRSLLE